MGVHEISHDGRILSLFSLCAIVSQVGTLDPVADFKTLVGKGRFTEGT